MENAFHGGMKIKTNEFGGTVTQNVLQLQNFVMAHAWIICAKKMENVLKCLIKQKIFGNGGNVIQNA